jgi:hypothetical protein
MTSSPQARPRKGKAEDSRRRKAPDSGKAEGSVTARVRQSFPAVDPSSVFGCVDWFLYPDPVSGPALR